MKRGPKPRLLTDEQRKKAIAALREGCRWVDLPAVIGTDLGWESLQKTFGSKESLGARKVTCPADAAKVARIKACREAGMTLSEIAAKEGVSKQRIDQFLARNLPELRGVVKCGRRRKTDVDV